TAASVLSLGLSIYGVYSYPTLTFYLLPTRAWELGLGAILAALAGQRNVLPRWWAQVGSGLGLLGILIAVFGYSTQTPFPGLAALLPCVGTGLIIWTNEKQATWVGRVLAWRGLVGIGLISYSLYLWHWPILVFTRYWIDPESLALRVGLLIGSILLAILTWKYVETPFRQRRWCAARKSIFTFAGVTLLVMIGAGLLIRNTRDMLPWGLPEAAQRYAREKMMDMQRLGKYQRKLPDIVRDNYYELGAGDRAQPAHLLVWGDSHAQSVMPVLEELCRDHALRGVAATHSNLPPAYGFDNPDLRGKASDYYNAVVTYVRQHRVPNVLLVAKWARYDDGTNRLQQGVARTVADLQATGTKVWIMKIVPQHKNDIPRALAAGALMGPQPEALAWPVPEYLATKPREDTYFSGLTETGIKLLDPADYLLDEQKQGRVVWDGKALYYDLGHISLAGAQRLRPLLEPILRAHASNTQPKSD
ncbi:MAG: acyltransferase family protein, partial [Phycisphaerae bacterium]